MNALDGMDDEGIASTAEEREAARVWIADNLTACDFVGDAGCSDPDCRRCHSTFGPTNLRTLGQNLATVGMLCRAWRLGHEELDWCPGWQLDAAAARLDPKRSPLAWVLSRPDLAVDYAGLYVAISTGPEFAIVAASPSLGDLVSRFSSKQLSSLYLHSFPPRATGDESPL